MDFLAAQDAARERTARLLWLFALAVRLTVLQVLTVHFAASNAQHKALLRELD